MNGEIEMTITIEERKALMKTDEGILCEVLIDILDSLEEATSLRMRPPHSKQVSYTQSVP